MHVTQEERPNFEYDAVYWSMHHRCDDEICANQKSEIIIKYRSRRLRAVLLSSFMYIFESHTAERQGGTAAAAAAVPGIRYMMI